MTDPQFWQAVGRVLAARREGLGYVSPYEFSKAIRDAPNPVTIRAIEEGRPGQTAMLSDYCNALGLKLTDVLREALPGNDVAAESLRLARDYERQPGHIQAIVRSLVALKHGPDSAESPGAPTASGAPATKAPKARR